MKLLVVSHKQCWPDAASPSGYATDGGFPLQARALSELFDATTLALPIGDARPGGCALDGHQLSVLPLTPLDGVGAARRLRLVPWLVRNARTIGAAVRAADAVHAPIPGDVGTIGLVLALAARRPLFVRHCGNWLEPTTVAEHAWRAIMERIAGGRNVMLATGGADAPPSARNGAVAWIFSSSLGEADLDRIGARPRDGAGDRPRLLVACRQTAAKGTDLVIRALGLLADPMPGLRLDVAGDGPARPELERLSRELGLGDRVAFHGAVDRDRVLALLQRADLFCLVSAGEGFPKAALEALASGVPVVASKVSVLPHLLRTGCGVTIERTPEAVAAAIRSCIGDREQYAAMSREAIRVARQFSLERWRDEIGARLSTAWGRLRTDA